MTTIRLATANTNPEVYLNKYIKALGPPSIRLAVAGGSGGTRFLPSKDQAEIREAFFARHKKGKKMKSDQAPTVRLSAQLGKGRGMPEPPTVRLAHCPGAQGDNVLLGQKGVEILPDELAPALLVSYVYLEPFLKNRHRYSYRDWALDSGAFSAHNSGTTISLEEYIEKCLELRKTDPTLTDIFSLDVIGDHRASLKNTAKMWDAGVDAIPTFHVGSPTKALLDMAKEFPKIALGGAVGFHQKLDWAKQCFARIWPKPIHGLGFSGERAILSLPWHSVDATNWEIAPCKFGNWKSFGKMSVRGSDQNLRAEVEWYLKLEQRARERWAAQMKELEGMGPSVRLAISINRGAKDRIADAMPKKGAKRG